MTKEQLIEFARRAGFVVDEKSRQYQPNCIFHTHHMVDELLTRFASLVRSYEREQCAKVADEYAPNSGTAKRIAHEIRSRK